LTDDILDLAGRAVLLQMRTGPWPVAAPLRLWRWLETQGWVRPAPVMADIAAGWTLCSKGYEELDRLGWGGPDFPGRPSPEAPAR